MYDYIIVGAGSAGCVLAHRLTENPLVKVLLIEAGGSDKKLAVRMPIAAPTLLKGPSDWDYLTEAQEQLKDRKLDWPRGKMLGGTSSLNFMIYIRGNKYDFEQWKADGNVEWGYEDVLPYFKKSERQQRGPSKYHGADGLLNVSDQISPHVLSQRFLDAGAEIGLSVNEDFNGDTQDGVGLIQLTQKHGARNSTADAYLRPALKRPNLTVIMNTLVEHITFEGKRATGVTYKQENVEKQAKASQEVILCGGVVNSPQLLLLSGVGPVEQLQSFDIPVIEELPGVGQNLQDHVLVPMCYKCTQPVTLVGANTFGNFLKYLLFKKGPLTSNIGEAAAFYKTSEDLPAPDIEMAFTPLSYLDQKNHGFTVGPMLVAPKSRGYLALRSRDPQQPPSIQPNYLEHEDDVHALIEGMKLSRRLAHAHAFDAYRGDEFAPGEKVQSDEDLTTFIRDNAISVYHPAGTCKMGDDAMAVVDSELRVHGVEHLRVVDVSIMPTLVRGHTNASAIMIAEKAADLIKKTFQEKAQEKNAITVGES